MLVVGFVIFNPDFVQERLQKSTGTDLRTASSGRLDIWTAAILVMAEWPISFVVGYGWNSYSYSGIWKSAHNEYIDRLYELGIIGLTIFCLLLRALIERAKRALSGCDTESKSIFIGYAFGMIATSIEIFFSSLPDSWTVIWVVTGIVIGLSSNCFNGSARVSASS